MITEKINFKLKICHKIRDHKFTKNEFYDYSYVRSVSTSLELCAIGQQVWITMHPENNRMPS